MNRTTIRALMLATACCAVPALAADLTPILSNGPSLTDRQEHVAKAIALSFDVTLFGESDPQLAADLYADPSFKNHDVEEPSGAQNYANFFLKPKEYGNPNAMPRSGPKVPAARAITRLFTITDGDITMMAYPSADPGDPGGKFASNMMEVKNGRVAQWWFSGPSEGGSMGPPPGGAAPRRTAAAPAPTTPPPAPDYTQYYPVPGVPTAGMPVIINVGTGTRAERDANKQLVTDFFNSFFNNNDSSAAQYLSPDLKCHVTGCAQGADFAAFATRNKATVTSADTSKVLFLLAEGNLVDIGFPVYVDGDPGGWYTQNLVRVENGKITEWWYSSRARGAPRRRWKMPAT